MSNSTSIKNASLVSDTPAPSSSDFCITCGFDFGNIISGMDNKIAGFFFVFLAFTLLCTPCIVMACCYMCKKSHSNNYHAKSKRKNKYSEVDKADEENDESDGEV
jgi:hypothetical protein